MARSELHLVCGFAFLTVKQQVIEMMVVEMQSKDYLPLYVMRIDSQYHLHSMVVSLTEDLALAICLFQIFARHLLLLSRHLHAGSQGEILYQLQLDCAQSHDLQVANSIRWQDSSCEQNNQRVV